MFPMSAIPRRQFLKSSVASSLVTAAEPRSFAGVRSSPIVTTFSHEDHRRRLLNIQRCEQTIRTCLRRHTITSYLSGQAAYNLGEYPSRTPWVPDENDEQELDQLRDHGITLIQIMEEWNDLLRLFGGNKFTAVNPPGLSRFLAMAHKRGMKVLLYISTGFMQATDPDFRADWARPGRLQLVHWNMARCSPASPGWRAYLLPRIVRILDEYEIDGLYNDFGYLPLSGPPAQHTADEVLAFRETANHDGALEDLLFLLHSEVKRRGGILKLHQDGLLSPHTAKLYDYLWVGEGIDNADRLREAAKNYAPFVVPCFDMSRLKMDDPNEAYLHTVPYVQFPLLMAGRPFTGERALVPGVKYYPSSWTDRWRSIWRYYQDHRKGPFTYGIWDYFPGRPECREIHARWLKLYSLLASEGTRAYIQIADATFFRDPLPDSIVASAFAGRESYLVIANYGRGARTVTLTEDYVRADTNAGPRAAVWEVAQRSLLILKRIPQS
jgi:hypothetical protein